MRARERNEKPTLNSHYTTGTGTAEGIDAESKVGFSITGVEPLSGGRKTPSITTGTALLAHFQELTDRVDSIRRENAEIRMMITVLVIQLLLEHHRISDELREENAELLAKHEQFCERIGTQLRGVNVEIEAALRCVDDFTGGDGLSETPRSIMDQRF